MLKWILLENNYDFQNKIDKQILVEIKKLHFWKSIEVLEHEPVMTVNDVVRILKIDSLLIIKSLFFLIDMDCLCLVNLSGSDRADMQKIKNIVSSEKIKLLKPESISLRTNLPLGAISPLVYNQPPILIDNKINENRYCYMGTGLNNYSFRIMSEKFRELDYLTWCDLRIS